MKQIFIHSWCHDDGLNIKEVTTQAFSLLGEDGIIRASVGCVVSTPSWGLETETDGEAIHSDEPPLFISVHASLSAIPQLGCRALCVQTGSYHLHHVLLSRATENLDQLPGKNETNFYSFMVSVSFQVSVNMASLLLTTTPNTHNDRKRLPTQPMTTTAHNDHLQ